jgi:hypothetical protein
MWEIVAAELKTMMMHKLKAMGEPSARLGQAAVAE